MQQLNDYFVYMNRWKQEVHDRLFKWLVNFVTSYILVLMIKSMDWEPTSFLINLVPVWMIYSAVQCAFWAVMTVAWQYNENKFNEINKKIFGE